jgi:hypothetical protein
MQFRSWFNVLGFCIHGHVIRSCQVRTCYCLQLCVTCCCCHLHSLGLSLITGFLSPDAGSWTSGAPHHWGFKFQIVALSLLMCHALSTACLFFFFLGGGRESVEFFLVLFLDILIVPYLQLQWPQWFLVWWSISYSTLAEFLCLNFYILISI